MVDLIWFLLLLGAGYAVGTVVEKKHYQSLKEREERLLGLPVVPSENMAESQRIERAEMVYGSVVVGTDYFKLVFAGLRNLLGGHVSAFETLLDRGRREAILRMKEKVSDADIILNLRIESCQISQTGTVEVLAYGTAVCYKKQ